MFFMYPPTERNLGCLQVLAIINKDAINIHLWVFVWPKFSTALGKVTNGYDYWIIC